MVKCGYHKIQELQDSMDSRMLVILLSSYNLQVT